MLVQATRCRDLLQDPYDVVSGQSLADRRLLLRIDVAEEAVVAVAVDADQGRREDEKQGPKQRASRSGGLKPNGILFRRGREGRP